MWRICNDWNARSSFPMDERRNSFVLRDIRCVCGLLCVHLANYLFVYVLPQTYTRGREDGTCLTPFSVPSVDLKFLSLFRCG